MQILGTHCIVWNNLFTVGQSFGSVFRWQNKMLDKLGKLYHIWKEMVNCFGKSPKRNLSIVIYTILSPEICVQYLWIWTWLIDCMIKRPLQHPISRLRDFTRFGGKTSYRLVNRGPVVRTTSLCILGPQNELYLKNICIPGAAFTDMV